MRIFLCLSLILSGCSSFLPDTLTQGEEASSYSYVPLDPMDVQESVGFNCGYDTKIEDIKKNETTGMPGDYIFEDLPDAFPDNTVRIAYKTINKNGNISYGPIGASIEGGRYQIVIDYIKSDTVNEKFYVKKVLKNSLGAVVEIPYHNVYDLAAEVVRYEVKHTININPTDKEAIKNYSAINIPIYVGIGLRITADIITNTEGVGLSGLGALSLAVENKRVSGSLVVQTLGISGKSITASMPIQSELNASSVQNAIVAIGAIKALMYEKDTVLKPRIVGFYNALGAGKNMTNAIISELSSSSAYWNRPCTRI